jgi:uncharacterized delta-60 repeat protein
MKSIKLILLLAFFFSVGSSFAQDGLLDTLFNYEAYNRFHNGKKFLGNTQGKEIAVDGNSIFLGTIDGGSYDGITAHGMIKLHEDGALDASFTNLFPPICDVKAIAVQTDGKIIVGGEVSSYGAVTVNNLLRLNQDGSLDLSFDIGAGPYHPNGGVPEIEDIKILANGKIVVVGNFFTFDGDNRKGVVVLNSDGSVDSGFNPGSGFSTIDDTGTRVVEVQEDGKIIVGGSFFNFDGYSCNGLIRLLPNGNDDPTFSLGLGASGVGYYVSQIVLDDQQRMVIGGNFNSYQGVSSENLCRLNPFGNVDLAFSSGTGLTNPPSSIGLQSDGSYIIATANSAYNGSIVDKMFRLDSLGLIDLSFNYNVGPDNYVSGLFILNNDDIILQGTFQYFDGMFKRGSAKLFKDGDLDLSYATSTGINGINASVRCSKHQQNNKILVGGMFTEYNGMRSGSLVRLFPDGTPDTLFTPEVNNYVYDIDIQSDGKIIIGGSFDTVNGQPLHGIARLMPDGSTDNSFNVGGGTSNTGPFNYIKSVAIQETSGKIYAVGLFDTINGEPRQSVARLNQDGSVDLTFTCGLNTSSVYQVWQIEAVQPNKCLVLGPFGSSNKIYRLMDDGTEDPAYNSYAFSSARGFGIRSDGKIVAFGVNQNSWNSGDKDIELMDENGVSDPSFTSGTGFAGGVPNDMVVQPDNKLILVGNYANYNGNTANGIVRVNVDGTIDNSFDVNSGFIYHNLHSVDLDGEFVIAGGYCATYQGQFQNNITRIHSGVCTDQIVNITETACGSYTAPSGNTYSNTGYYTDIINTSLGCDSIINIDLTVLAAPDTTVTIINGVLSAAQSSVIYQWLDCDNNMNPILNANQQTFTPTTNGSYAVEMTLGTCVITSSCLNYNEVGILVLSKADKEIVLITDLLGRIINLKPNTPALVHYSDGTIERIFIVE